MSLDSLRLQGFRRDRVIIGPKFLTIHLTSRCNYACFYCTHHSKLVPEEHRAKKFDLDFDIFKTVIDDAKALNVERVVFSGRGEPFLHNRIYEMIDYVKDRGLMLTVLTNGTFSRKRIKTISRIDDLKINLNSLDETIFKETQLGTSKNHQTVLENISILARIKQLLRHPNIRLLFLLNKHNIKEMQEIIAFGEKNRIDFIEFFPPHVLPEMKDFILTVDGINEMRRICQSLLKQKNSYLARTNIKHIVDNLSATPERITLSSYSNIVYFEQEFGEKFQCAAGWYYLIIGKEGNVYPCCQYNDEVLSVGNIYQNRLKDIWFSSRFEVVRHRMKYEHNIKDPFWKRCNNCQWTIHLSAILKEARGGGQSKVHCQIAAE